MGLPFISTIPTAKQIEQVHEAIAPFVHRTPVWTSQSIHTLAGCKLHFKCENFQKIGAFKMRGAMAAALAISELDRPKGIATHSSGNHAQAIALAAQILGIPAYIVMPHNAPLVKQKATKSYGATVILCEATQDSRLQTLEDVVAKTGATFIPSYNHYDVIAGQATAAKELLEHASFLDTIIAPVGGGGLLSGTCLAAHYWSPNTICIGAEPKAADDAARSLIVGSIQTNTTTDTIADGLRTNLGDKTFGILQQYLSDIITVTETEIVASMRLIWQRLKIVVEPSAAVPLAAVLQQPERFAGQQIGIILSGGNVEFPLSKI